MDILFLLAFCICASATPVAIHSFLLLHYFFQAYFRRASSLLAVAFSRFWYARSSFALVYSFSLFILVAVGVVFGVCDFFGYKMDAMRGFGTFLDETIAVGGETGSVG